MKSTQEKIIRPNLGNLEPAKQLGCVSQVCKVIGVRGTFYHFRDPYAQGRRQRGGYVPDPIRTVYAPEGRSP